MRRQGDRGILVENFLQDELLKGDKTENRNKSSLLLLHLAGVVRWRWWQMLSH
jgi:hypothetical protein